MPPNERVSIPHKPFPCRPCPWRKDNIGRLCYPNLREYAAQTCGAPGAEAPLGAEMFACHASRTDPAELCAGWLAVAGYEHLTVRLAIATGALPAGVLTQRAPRRRQRAARMTHRVAALLLAAALTAAGCQATTTPHPTPAPGPTCTHDGGCPDA